MEERGWEYRRRHPEGTVLYEAVRGHLTTLLAEASKQVTAVHQAERVLSRVPSVDAVLRGQSRSHKRSVSYPATQAGGNCDCTRCHASSVTVIATQSRCASAPTIRMVH